MPSPSTSTLHAGQSLELLWALFWVLLCAVFGSMSTGCAVLPDWHHGETREFSVLVDYEVDGGDFVVLPASNDWMTVLQLHTRPGGMRETFDGRERRVYPPPQARHLQVLCRYKLYSRRDRAGRRLPWPTAAELFPGATRIRHAGTGGRDLDDLDFAESGDLLDEQQPQQQ